MAMIIDQRAQLLQTLGSIGTSAANAATEGIAEAAKTDSKSVDTALKLFGGFERNEFENINGQAPNLLVQAVRPPASYEAPAEYFKPLSNTMEGQGLLVLPKDLLQQLEDPRFRMADGLSGFSDNRITQTLAQKVMIDPGDMAASFDSLVKLYRMENTVEKQLQLHEQLNLGAFGNFSGLRQNPRLDRGLKDMPDAQIATGPPLQKEMLNLWEHAMTGTPETVGEFYQMLDTISAKVQGIEYQTVNPKIIEECLDFSFLLNYVKVMFKHLPQRSISSAEMLSHLEPLRVRMRNLIYMASNSG